MQAFFKVFHPTRPLIVCLTEGVTKLHFMGKGVTDLMNKYYGLDLRHADFTENIILDKMMQTIAQSLDTDVQKTNWAHNPQSTATYTAYMLKPHGANP